MKIAFLEDDIVFAKQILTILQEDGHEVLHFVSGRECLKAIHADQFDMILLDWEVADVKGTEVLESLKLKGNYPPVVFLTAHDSEEDVVAVMSLGADDYIIKPPNHQLLLARIHALHRRNNHKNLDTLSLNFDGLSVDFSKRRFIMDGETVKLTEKETDLALYFFKQMGVLLTRNHLTKVVWGSSPDVDTRTIDVHVSHLRSKLKLTPEFGWRLASVYHQGYRLERLN